MPELPEVETIARGLHPLLSGHRIEEVAVRYPGTITGDARDFRKLVRKRSIRGVRRRGKLLMIDLDRDVLLAFHFKMTGKLLYRPGGAEVDKHTHLVFSLSGGSNLHFQDTRKFGYCLALAQGQLCQWPFFASLGPEPLDMDPGRFASIASAARGRVKAFLLDQKRIAGIGNIYADEALFLAGIHPAAPIGGLERKRLLDLHECLRTVLSRAIEAGGTTFRDYADGLGRPGSYQEHFQVYGRGGQPCRRCGTTLARARVAGRTSVFCSRCQPAA